MCNKKRNGEKQKERSKGKGKAEGEGIGKESKWRREHRIFLGIIFMEIFKVTPPPRGVIVSDWFSKFGRVTSKLPIK